MHGVELPCGSVLTVEPADMNYKEMNRLNGKKDGVLFKSQSIQNHCSSRSGEETSNTKVIDDDTQKTNSKNSENADDDLESFFDSL